MSHNLRERYVECQRAVQRSIISGDEDKKLNYPFFSRDFYDPVSRVNLLYRTYELKRNFSVVQNFEEHLEQQMEMRKIGRI